MIASSAKKKKWLANIVFHETVQCSKRKESKESYEIRRNPSFQALSGKKPLTRGGPVRFCNRDFGCSTTNSGGGGKDANNK